MGSICGFFNTFFIDVKYVLRMLDKMSHRGPDSCGLYLDGKVWKVENLKELFTIEDSGKISLGYSDLKINGKPNPVQPFFSCDKRLVMVYDGDLYNYKEAKNLIGEHDMETRGNIEVLVHMIEEFYDGDLISAVKKTIDLIDAIYAFAVTDGDSIVLGRDSLGVKPVYFTKTMPFSFASERKALNRSEIYRLDPGKLFEISEQGVKMHEGIKINKPAIIIDKLGEAVEEYRRVFRRAVKKRVRGLKKVGMLFSGGVDSTLMAKYLKDLGVQLKCYCVGVNGSSDIENAREAAQLLGLDLRVMNITKEIIDHFLPEIIESIELDGLLQVEVAIPMYLGAKMASEDGFRVLFCGQGPDELFGGYSWYKDVIREEGYLSLHEKQWEDLRKLYLDCFERDDKATMAHSIELRAPYLDVELIQTAMKISPKIKVRSQNDDQRKIVHRDLALKMGVPKHIAYRKKIMAQEGSNIHALIQEIAKEYFKDNEMLEKELEIWPEDYGSTYRYVNEKYGEPETWAYIRKISAKVNNSY
ncbi:MAG: asparagine synthetase B family protein [Candidatus Hodarchaeota archaeon]